MLQKNSSYADLWCSLLYLSDGWILTNRISRSKSCVFNWEIMSNHQPSKNIPPIYISTNSNWSFPHIPHQKYMLSNNSNKLIFCRRSHLKIHSSKTKPQISLFACIHQCFKILIQFVINFNTSQDSLPPPRSSHAPAP